MEEQVFRLPTVGGTLRERYVEARLHADDKKTPGVMERVQKLQDELAGSRATPYYLILDPTTRESLGRFPGPDLLSGGDDFHQFLLRALD
jgi:hypothetical protein